MKPFKTALLISSLFTATAFAQDSSEATGQWQWGASLSTIGLNTQQANTSGIDDGAAGLALYGMYIKSDWITTLSMEYMRYSDNNKFTQTVEGEGWANDGDVSTESSNASAGVLSVATGKFWRFGEQQDIVVTAQAGFSVVTASERKIEHCRNCYSEDIDMDGGLFIKTSVVKNLETVSWGLQLSQHLSGDGIENSMGITFQTAF